MKALYALFEQSGAFLRFEQLDLALLPPVPLADDGLPRAVAVSDAPEIAAGQSLAYSRAGWVVIEGEVPVPSVLPAWRILSVMDLHGYTATVEAIIESLPKSQRVVAKRQLAGSNIERTHALVLAAQQALGLTDEQVDDLFREADALT